jgi:hypothetical protein
VPRGDRRLLVGVVASGCAALVGCGRTQLEPAGADATFVQTFAPFTGDVDMLLMIDDSLTMSPIVDRLIASFPAFVEALDNLPGGRPGLHIAVVSSDLGAGQWTRIPHCTVGGDGGRFRDQVGPGAPPAGGAPCPATVLAPGAHFISDVGGVENYDTTLGLAGALSCIANLGEGGCGFEHQLASVARALGADGTLLPPENAGFLRPDAQLVIVFLTNEDDCSAPDVTDLFDTSSSRIVDPLGPMQSYRCNEFGHLCDGAPPPRTMAASFPPGACVPAEERGELIPVATLVRQIKSVKADPNQVSVVVIAGPRDPYEVVMVNAVEGTSDSANGVPWPNVSHSCKDEVGVTADPGVRLVAFVDAFGGNGAYGSACADTYLPVLTPIVRTAEGPPPRCLSAVPPGVDPTAPVLPAACTVTLETPSRPTLSACTATAGEPCFTLGVNATCRDSGLDLVLRLNDEPPLREPGVTLRCAVTAAAGG